MKTLIVTPTYNERKNIRELVSILFELNPDFHILVVDDSSPDGTAEIVEELQADCANLHLLSRNEKTGLGSAYIAGFNYALERDYEAVVQMDADMSHDPKDVPLLIEAIENADLAIGSRYISGINVVNWPLQRLIISYGANIYTRLVTRLPVRDATGGFKCWRREALEAINLDGVRSQGYSFQIEMTYRVWLKGFRITEIPIIFVDRTVGESKMTRSIMIEAAVMIPRLRIWKLFGWHK
ncbi:MAG TPA: polyprenol monophosphomannose synthase [Candidatus Marinimicrobia bacterium]|nr:polyprenol monophosphomannose synthase [Candidatus Neomarinimicrobiota bacterium]MDP7121553.1 polyprenol monophosphomannose synthase [Candidatus Neomarinimicrobiota bacterium]MDP7528980.1 polyprenol monophosphomannose synthase [Candidatus Neomarinimicrobiota bacterium]MDP7716579.1 polyprenol monophosphomannose synthase [Candidatus Neomarinimicrobiota bacterium]HJL84350.1 polyprenol monophosphomannose synthase [Candidatus Neomarinimicrobiota bacterium]